MGIFDRCHDFNEKSLKSSWLDSICLFSCIWLEWNSLIFMEISVQQHTIWRLASIWHSWPFQGGFTSRHVEGLGSFGIFIDIYFQ